MRVHDKGPMRICYLVEGIVHPRQARKTFFPDGRDIPLIGARSFRDYLAQNVSKILLARDKAIRFNIIDIMFFGETPFNESGCLATTLYERNIDPRFFAAAFLAIANQSIPLSATTKRIDLARLGREYIASTFEKPEAEKLIGREFENFGLPGSDRIAILRRLGVIQDKTFVRDKPAQKERATFPPTDEQPRLVFVLTPSTKNDKPKSPPSGCRSQEPAHPRPQRKILQLGLPISPEHKPN